MKILVLSLLRIGDLLQQKPLLRRLREKHPAAEIHILANASVLSARGLFPEVDLWHSFDRDRLQQAVGTAEVNLFAPLRELEELIEELSREHYDQLLNFTHNRLSAQLASLIPATEKRGLLAEGISFRTFENSWLRHLNDRFGRRDASPFHYVELLAGAFDLGVIPAPVVKSGGDHILLQPLTSDAKKNWGLSSWRRLADRLKEQFPGMTLRVLGAPFEAEKLRQVFDNEELEIADWAGLQSLFPRTALLVSGDTSVKHLAALNGVRVLEIALGSADPAKTGTYAQGAWVLHSTVDCAPCPHSSPCRRLSHLCGEVLPVADVTSVAAQILGNSEVNLPRENPSYRLLKTAWSREAGWILRDSRSESRTQILEVLDKAAWTLSLSPEELAPIGSVSWALRRDLAMFEGWGEAVNSFRREQVELRSLAGRHEKRLAVLARACMAGQYDPQVLQQERRDLATLIPGNHRVRRHWLDMQDLGHQPFSSPLHFFGSFRRKLDELTRRLDLHDQMIQQLLEGGTHNGQSSRDLSDRGPEAP